MAEGNVKEKKYILCEYTFKELQNKVIGSNSRYSAVELLKYNVYSQDEFDDEQKKIQNRHRWNAEESGDIRLWGNLQDEFIEKTIEDEIFVNNLKENISTEIHKKMMNTKIIVTASFKDFDNGRIGLILNYEPENCLDKDKYDYVKDDTMLMQALRLVKDKSYNYNTEKDEYVYLESLTIREYPYQFEEIDKFFTSKIKKYIRENLSYCLKKDALIVPEEYMNKGKTGVEEWRNIKSSNNKNNSIEKKLLKQTLKDKKNYALDCMSAVMLRAVFPNGTSMGRDWSLPFIEIDGRFNYSRTRKLVNTILKDKSDQDLIKMPEEEIQKLFKDFWKDKLMELYNSVDNYDYSKENR